MNKFPEQVASMLDLICLAEDEVFIHELGDAIDAKFPPNENRDFDNGMDRLWALFNSLL